MVASIFDETVEAHIPTGFPQFTACMVSNVVLETVEGWSGEVHNTISEHDYYFHVYAA